MPVYTVENPEGKRVKFEWAGTEAPTDADMEEVFVQAASFESPTPTEQLVVPEWGREHPNLYGVAGAAYETAKPVVEALGLAGGAIVGSGAGPVGTVAGAGLGYAGAKELTSLAGEALGVEKRGSVIEEVKEAGEHVVEGAVMEATGQIIGKVLPIVWQGTKKGLIDAKNYITKLTPEKQKQAVELIKLAEKHNVPLTYGDIKKGSIEPKLEVAMESVPGVGMGGFREGQNIAVKKAAMIQLKKQTPPSVDDWADIAQKGLKSKAKIIKDIAAKKYNKVAKLADPLGNAPTSNMNETASNIIKKEMEKLPEYRDANLVSTLQKYTKDPSMKWSGLRELRSDLGDDIADFYKGKNAIVGQKGVGKLQSIKNALEKDMEEFTKSKSPQLKHAWKTADKYYKEKVIPFKDSALAKASTTNTPDEIYKSFIQRGKRDRALKFYNALDNKGRQAVRYGIVEDAFESASTRDNIFSPAKFANKMKELEASTGVFFKGRNKEEIRGFARLMRHAERSGQYLENPPTGQRAIPFLVGAGAVASPTAVAGGGTATYALRKLFTTSAGKQLLFSASRAPVGSPKMEKIIEAITKTFMINQEPNDRDEGNNVR